MIMKKVEMIEQNSESVHIKVEGKEYSLLPHTFASISNNKSDPLYCVSVANNSFSIDLWRGCPLNCAYCHVQGCYEDLENWTNCYLPKPRTSFSEGDVVEALVHYKWFVPHKSIISIDTSSTEPFLNDAMIRSTLAIMNAFVSRGYRNPFWIVTKIGFPDEQYFNLFRNVIDNGNKIIVSICWSNNRPYIEPQQKDRFRNIDAAAMMGVMFNWYMRPLCAEWNASVANIRDMAVKVSDYADTIKNITPGGLRWTEGVEFGIWAVHDQPMPNLVRSDNVKTLSEESINSIKELCSEIIPGKPIYFKSSCALCHMLQIPNFNLVDIFNSSYCRMSVCPEDQRKLCKNRRTQITSQVSDMCLDLGYRVSAEGGRLSIEPVREVSYQEQELVKKIVSFI